MGKKTDANKNSNKKKKKKGRPSLLDLQKRSLKQQHQNQIHEKNPYSNPNFAIPGFSNPIPVPGRRSTRRNTNSSGISSEPDSIDGDDDDDERIEKKVKLVVRLPSDGQRRPRSNSISRGFDSFGDRESRDSLLKKQKINAVRVGSGDEKEEKKGWKATNAKCGSQVESGPTKTPLPDKKLLVFILDRLQKKDTYGVFSEPVDPNELPDYHEMVDHPMDFGTVRKKLDGGLYSTLEQFERDVSLICSNAMQYNSPDTIYFRQARSIQELARKDFENLRQESDESEPQSKVARRGRPPKKLKKSVDSSPFERVGPEFSSDATLATGGDNTMFSNSYNLRKVTNSYKFKPGEASIRASHRSRNCDNGWLSERKNGFQASMLKGISMKYGKTEFVVDENRRDTYKESQEFVSGHELPVLTMLDGDMRQLMAVGVHMEHGYATSLARFAANLGPYVWEIASKKIERALPGGIKFGPGWVGEDVVTSLNTPPLLNENPNPSNHSCFGNYPNRPQIPFPSKEVIAESDFTSPEQPMIQSNINVSNGRAGYHYDSEETKLSDRLYSIQSGCSFGANTSHRVMPQVGFYGKPSWAHGFSMNHEQSSFVVTPPDLNVGFHEPGSPSSCLIGSPQPPDLVLQL